MSTSLGVCEGYQATLVRHKPTKLHMLKICLEKAISLVMFVYKGWNQVWHEFFQVSMIVSACRHTTANPTARNEFSTFQVLLNASIWSWNMSWAACERWAAETLTVWRMIATSLTLTSFVAKILSLRPGRPQIQPIWWQLYWNAAYMISDYD
jgi:hypothetical protein